MRLEWYILPFSIAFFCASWATKMRFRNLSTCQTGAVRTFTLLLIFFYSAYFPDWKVITLLMTQWLKFPPERLGCYWHWTRMTIDISSVGNPLNFTGKCYNYWLLWWKFRIWEESCHVAAKIFHTTAQTFNIQHKYASKQTDAHSFLVFSVFHPILVHLYSIISFESSHFLWIHQWSKLALLDVLFSIWETLSVFHGVIWKTKAAREKNQYVGYGWPSWYVAWQSRVRRWKRFRVS